MGGRRRTRGQEPLALLAGPGGQDEPAHVWAVEGSHPLDSTQLSLHPHGGRRPDGQVEVGATLGQDPQEELVERDPWCRNLRSEEHTSELQSLMRTSYAVLCLKKK